MTQPRLLGGRYELDGVVGRGGMAEVYRARDIRLDRIVAIKTLRSDLARDHTFQARFRREAQSAASLNHPAVVAVYDTGEDVTDGTPVPYIVMEYVDGRTLRDLLRADRRLMPERAAELVDGILRALDYSHRGGIVHRDIKPANVMITRAGDVKVMDFGIARAMADSAATMTQTAQVIGTAQYLSPEQARGERVDARSDIYSTGCVLYELLTGQPPFTGDSPVAIAYQHVREEPIPPSQIDPEIPQWADAIVLKAMAKDPAHRYQSASEMRADIQRAMTGMPVDAQTMAMNNTYAPSTRMMTSTQAAANPATQRTTAVPPYEYDEGGAGRGGGGRRRANGGGGGNTALKTAAWILVPLLVIGAFIGVGYAFLSNNEGPKAEAIKVPSLQTQTEQAAVAELTGLGLKPEVVKDYSDEFDPKTVIKTDPAEGTEVKKGDTVKVFVSKGKKKVKVPEGLIGVTKEEATQILKDAGLTATVKTKGTRGKQGTVVSTDPVAGAEVEDGGSVTLYVPKELTSLPDVTGMTSEEAKAALESAGFQVRISKQFSDQAEDTVIQQNPGPNAKLSPGTTVTIVVSKGPDQSQTQPTDQPTFTQQPDPSQPTDEPTDEQTTIEEPGGDDGF
ncbi:Stk1 family PASTA domain-containing Ser/Thr kinase [Nonomuraea sp. SMC257]|uniref:non-specific serine/threonine protein kinase n=1 Tax=Nonomuraea montanisoli TaxID=2741721 RepID=A0A7Y6IHS5_9ACTN|nr:Stk1 family PASTA domain-containing Ser/Thr kinase [Nonomuraea montanisoli]NUW37074.1 Stk1 family PASTA domain-containing Ser/Thr kinase [Nonomuraea montanisoli]